MAVLAPPVVVVTSGAPPFVAVSGNAPPFVAVSGNAPPITIVADGAPPITLLNEDGSIWTGGGPAPPVLSAASAADFSDIFVWGRATTDTASGTLYAVVVPSAAATPSAGQIVAGTDAAGAAAPNASVAITSTGVKNVLVRGLTAVTAYKICMTHMIAAVRLISAYSNVVTGSFTTDTLVLTFATNGLATGMGPSTGCGPVGTNIADPHGGTNAVRYVDNNDGLTNQVLVNCNGTFFNGVNKLHVTAKTQGGAAWLRQAITSISVPGVQTYFNASTGATGTSSANWTPPPVIFNVGSGWWMFSGRADLTGADVIGSLGLGKSLVDNVLGSFLHDGTHIQDIYNIRITRV